ncbi:MAG: hypothetical protein JXB19_10200 [Bacteroidales bacterium]|nr:hypothetical protein [Bacteroidales bacterium]
MINHKNLWPVFILASLFMYIALFQACRTYYFRSNYSDTNLLLHNSNNLLTKPFLKAHLRNGDVCILTDTWQVDSIHDLLSGNGNRYNYNRRLIYEGFITIPIDSVAIFETNAKLTVSEEGRIALLGILAAADIALGVYCVRHPKACYGSCPTFYLDETVPVQYADAEGFSNAITPSMEQSDIDALNNQQTTGGTFSVTMKNDALETHCVNDVQLLAFPRKENEKVYQSPSDDFYLCSGNYKVHRVTGPEGDITSLLNHADRIERISAADRKNLSSKEEIYLDFENISDPGDLGLVISFRQSLMTTYFIYSALGYMGDEVGDILAKVETSPQTMEMLKNGLKKELGNIDVYAWNEKDEIWVLQGGFYEIGPIAFNHQILPLTNAASGAGLKLKLVINKGLWKIDYLALTNIKVKVMPEEIRPAEIISNQKIDPGALSQINAPDRYLISMPGSAYKFNFNLPAENQDYELFLCSKGYYLEWMRNEWIKDKNLLKLNQMIKKPKKYLNVEAKNYARYESTMEEIFWNSKVDADIYSQYEK